MGKKTVLDVKVKDVEKRRYPTKHYVYILEVNWSEGSSTIIYRRYSDFFEFQCGLLEMFPLEGGAKDPTQRMIPFLPGKKLFGRSHTRAVAEKRKEKIDDYCRALIRLPPHISDCAFVIDYFEVRQSDLEIPQKPKTMKGQPKINEISDPLILERYVAIADYEKEKKNECSVQAGQTVEVIDKNENGWWFVNVDDFNEGWVPATYLEPLYGSEDIAVQKLEPGDEETWISMSKYEAQHEDEIDFEKGVLVEVFEKGIDGWWKIRYQGKEGMAPAAYLRRYRGEGAGQASTGAQIVSSIKEATDSALNPPSSSSSSSSTTLTASSTSKLNPSSSSSTKPRPGRKTPPTPLSPISPTSLKAISLTTTPNISYGEHETSSSSNTLLNSTAQQKPSPAANLASALVAAGTPGSTTAASRTAPAPSPKPASSVAVAAAAVAEKQKFAPTWHSQAKPHVEEEPIYGPTPRRYTFKKPPLKKRDVPASSSSSDFPEPVYEIIPEPDSEIYMTIAEFQATAGDGISFNSGKECTVITKNPAGWWYVDMDGKEGWVPSSYLERKPKSPAVKSPTSPPAVLKSVPPGKKEPVKQQRREPPKKEESKEARSEPVKKEITKDTRMAAQSKDFKREPPSSQVRKQFKNETSPLGMRKMTLASKSTSSIDGELKRPSLKRSTSTDSGLNEEIYMNPLVNDSHAPPSIQVVQAPPKPNRPRNTPAFPSNKVANGPPSPRLGGRTTLSKTSISGPMPLQLSPNIQRKLETPLATKNVRTTSSNESSRSRPAPAKPASRPTVKRGNSDENVRLNSRSTVLRNENITAGNRKKISSPEIKVKALQESKSNRTEHVSSGVPSRPSAHKRRGSADNAVGKTYKSELEQKLFDKSLPSFPTQQPKRPSPPNRPKAPITKTNLTGTSKSKVPPSRPQPPKTTTTPAKRPPPPRPSAYPGGGPKKSTAYVTIGDYSGDTSGSCITFKEGVDVEVIEKKSDGWWFVKIGNTEGWAPCTYIEEKQQKSASKNTSTSGRPYPARPKPPAPSGAAALSVIEANKELEVTESTDSTPKPKPRPRPRKATTVFYRAIDSYDVPVYEDSGIPVTKGRVYELLEKSDSGWWLMKDGDTQGWAPSSYFEHV